MAGRFVVVLECDNCCHWGARVYAPGIIVRQQEPDGIGEVWVYRGEGDIRETLICPTCEGRIFNIMASAPVDCEDAYGS